MAAVPLPFRPPMSPSDTTSSSRRRSFRFTLKRDIDLLTEILNSNPYEVSGRWEEISDHLSTRLNQAVDAHSCKNRAGVLLREYRGQNVKDLSRCRRGTVDDLLLKQRLLRQVSWHANGKKGEHPREETKESRCEHFARASYEICESGGAAWSSVESEEPSKRFRSSSDEDEEEAGFSSPEVHPDLSPVGPVVALQPSCSANTHQQDLERVFLELVTS